MITEIHLPESVAKDSGLAPFDLVRMGRLVVFAGPNGAGKSRLLRLLSAEVPAWREHRRNAESADHMRRFTGAGGGDTETLQALDRAAHEAATRARVVVLDPPLIDRPSSKKASQAPRSTVMLRYVLSDVPDPRAGSDEANDAIVTANAKGGFGNALNSMHAYFDEIARVLYDARHPDRFGDAALSDRQADADAFNRTLDELVGGTISVGMSPRHRPIARFRDRPFKPSELSDGERVLVTWAIMLHRQKAWMSDAIVLIDEPETHLHPDACIKAIDSLQHRILGKSGQVIVATHSVPLLAYAGMQNIYFVENGAARFAGNNVDAVLDRLLGGVHGRTQLATLMSDSSAATFEAYAAQCLLPPGVAAPVSGDPQQEQMLNLVQQCVGAGKTLRILDYGAGKGRLAAALASQCDRSQFEYLAFNDPRFDTDDQRAACLESIRQLGQSGAQESYYPDSLERLSVPGIAPIDVVVMCNVLHEIPVTEWLSTFDKLHRLLSPKGELVIFEDQLPGVGELPHEKGHIVLNETGLQVLFGADAVRALPSQRDGRLTGFRVAAKHLTVPDIAAIRRTLGKVQRLAEEQIRQLRTGTAAAPSTQTGRRHAHLVVQYANASLALNELGPMSAARSA